MVNEDPKPESDFVNVKQRAAGRRKLLGRLLSLAGLGVVGALLSQEKTGILAPVEATTGTNVVTDQTNGGNTGTTEIDSTVAGGATFRAQNAGSPGIGIWGLGTGTNGVGLVGTSATNNLSVPASNVGVEGLANNTGGISVLGLSLASAAIPLVAQGANGQTANLQEWRNISGAALSVVNANGNFGIGTSTPSVALDVAGEAHATDFVATSDMRFKEEVTPIDGALDKVTRLQGVYFKWNHYYRDVLKRSNTKRRQVGVIAQQVREVLPEVVSEWGDKSGEGYLAVDCGRLAAVTIEAVKEQQNQIQQLRERISMLEDHLKRFTSS